MSILDIDLEELWRKYQGQSICFTVPPYPEEKPPEPPPSGVKKLTGYLYDESDAPRHIGEWYFLSNAAMTGKIASVQVGPHKYKYNQTYNGRDLWYGLPASGTIRVRLKDGTVYESEGEEAVSAGQEKARYTGRANGNRPHFRFSKPMGKYPRTFRFVADDGFSSPIANNGSRYERGSFLAKNGEHDGKLVILAPSSCDAKGGSIKW